MHAISLLPNIVRTYVAGRGANKRHGAYVSASEHIIIGGCGRSGTTLMRVIIDSHPRICCGPESEVFLPDRLDIPKLCRKYGVDRETILQSCRASGCRAEFIDHVAQVCCKMTGKPRWAEKTPRNVLNLDFLFAAFPHARFVHMLRDGRDVACSLRTHPRHRVKNGKLVPTNKWKPMEYCAKRWRDSLLAAKHYMSDRRFYTVRYEQLVAEPRRTLETLMTFLEEPWDDALLAHSEADSVFRDTTTFPQNPDAIKPIATASVARWQRDMTGDDKRVFKKIAGELLVEFGYAADQDW